MTGAEFRAEQIREFGAPLVTDRDRLGLGIAPGFDVWGIEPRVFAWFEKFDQQPGMRATMEFARRGGLTYSEARAALDDPDDLAAELAWDAFQASEESKKCGNCGVDPDDMQDSETERDLKHPRWRAEFYYCAACKELDKLREEQRATADKPGGDAASGQRIRMVSNE